MSCRPAPGGRFSLLDAIDWDLLTRSLVLERDLLWLIGDPWLSGTEVIGRLRWSSAGGRDGVLFRRLLEGDLLFRGGE